MLELGGAVQFEVVDGRPFVRDDYRGGSVELPFHLDEIGETPHLRAGDALVMRGDLFHKTQDMETGRVNISFRLADFDLLQTREHFQVSCEAKDHLMGKGQPGSFYELMAAVFKTRDKIPSGEMLRIVHE